MTMLEHVINTCEELGVDFALMRDKVEDLAAYPIEDYDEGRPILGGRMILESSVATPSYVWITAIDYGGLHMDVGFRRAGEREYVYEFPAKELLSALEDRV